MRVTSLVLLACLAGVASASNWALLVAGSNMYYNYRHQADVCHSYQTLIKNGFDKDHIITMYYDDIANNSENPVKNNLINQPNGPNVYEGCGKDYTGADVTPENFLKVLQGKNMQGVGTGRTVQSDSDSNVFVFFSDHGATGIIAFPSDELHASDLNDALNSMHSNNQYKEMLIYIEACEAGSMFNDILSSDINVLAVTASDPTHSSYACYYDDTRQTYLGDVFSVNWMQDSDAKSPSSESVGQQFDIVKQETNTSAVCAYGNLNIKSEKLAVFQTNGGSAVASSVAAPAPGADAIDSRDVEIGLLKHKIAAATDDATRSRLLTQLQFVLARRSVQDSRIQAIEQAASAMVAEHVDFSKAAREAAQARDADICNTGVNKVSNPACLKEMVAMYKKACGKFDSYSLSHVASLNAFCNAGLTASQLSQVMSHTCVDSYTN